MTDRLYIKGCKIFQDNYRFSYAVEDNYSGNLFGHYENHDGGGTAGVYHVRLPDGRLQTVEYVVDARGYHATVLYEGGSGPLPSPAPFIHAPAHVASPGHAYSLPVISNHPPPPPPPVLQPSLPTTQYATVPSYSLQSASYILPQARPLSSNS